MSKYDVEVKVERGAEGLVTRWGVSWAETRPGTEQWLMFLAGASGLAMLAGLVWLVVGGQMNPLLLIGLLGLGGAVLLLNRLEGKPRAVFFHADGRMQTPFGIHHRPGLAYIGGHHKSIVSIEARAQQEQPQVEGGWKRMYEIVMLSRGGDLICVSRNMLETSAIKAAAQLTIALNGVRKEEVDFLDAEYEGGWVTSS